ncbi:hypothetical protein PR001_g27832 [Phytophthora rubi]|uniref:Uncharacterized protein n=1 Tax=Phytophthora rubi TaxID=129364 RepID=A0A6A3HJE1_9STRA|nr:hypothetical protein PR001_g27832 [Phytophthora rubi]
MRIVTAGALSASSDAVPHDEFALPVEKSCRVWEPHQTIHRRLRSTHIKVQCNLVGVCTLHLAVRRPHSVDFMSTAHMKRFYFPSQLSLSLLLAL